MKQFFKFMFASMLGFFLTFVVISSISFGIILSVASLSKKDVVFVKENSVMTMKLDEAIQDRASNNPFSNMSFGSFKTNKALGLGEILKAIKSAATDKNIKGIYLELSTIPSGIATIEEIRNALIEFKKSGKFIYCYSEGLSQSAYYLATVSDKIFLNPEGGLIFKGLSAQIMFLKGMLEKLEIEPQIIRHGKFKSAIEPLILDKMSEANKEQTLKFLGTIWEHMVTGMSASRKLTVEDLNKIADEISVRIASDAVTLKLVDELAYYDEVQSKIKTKLGIGEKKKINFISISKYRKAAKSSIKTSKDKIAVVFASGDIVSGEGDDNNIGSTKISAAIRKARIDSSVKAIVLRVNSPGGSALASEVIWREVSLANKVKPVVVSMGDVAASGGYYIACAATKIIASPTTITGSIGVFGVIPNLQKFFKNKLGITIDGVSTNKHADYISAYRPMDNYEKEITQFGVESIYQSFIKHVAEGRKMTVDQVDSIGQGRVWSGVDAKRIGLIDDFGGMEKAVEIAAGLAKIKDYKIVGYPLLKDPFTQIIEDIMGNNTSESLIKNELGDNYIYFKYLKEISNMKGIQARMPYELVIY
jgi:protease-4